MAKYEVEMLVARRNKTWDTEMVELTQSEYDQGDSDVEHVAQLKLYDKYRNSNDIASITLYCSHNTLI